MVVVKIFAEVTDGIGQTAFDHELDIIGHVDEFEFDLRVAVAKYPEHLVNKALAHGAHVFKVHDHMFEFIQSQQQSFGLRA